MRISEKEEKGKMRTRDIDEEASGESCSSLE